MPTSMQSALINGLPPYHPKTHMVKRHLTHDRGDQLRSQVEADESARAAEARGFRAWENTKAYRRRREAADAYTPARLAMEAEKRRKMAPPLTQIFKNSLPDDDEIVGTGGGAIVSHVLGAAAVPAGVALMANARVRFKMELNALPSTWVQPKLRHPEYKHQCDLFSDERKEGCQRSLDPVLAQIDCPRAAKMSNSIFEIIAEYRMMHEGAQGVSIVRSILDAICQDDASNCAFDAELSPSVNTDSNGRVYRHVNGVEIPDGWDVDRPIGGYPKGWVHPGTVKSEFMSDHVKRQTMDTSFEHQLQRQKRFIFTLAIGLITGLALIGIALGGYAMYRTDELQSNVDQIADNMRKKEHSLQALLDDTKELEKVSEEMFSYVTESLAASYKSMETLRCHTQEAIDIIAEQAEERFLRDYVATTLKEITQASTTGQVTPELIPVNELKNLLAGHPTTRNSIVHANPSLVYKFGRILPVRLDFERLAFGYVLEIPVPEVETIYPIYKVDSVGYDLKLEDGSYKTMLPFLPPLAVYKPKSGMKALEPALCVPRGEFFMCDPAAVNLQAPDNACLDFMMRPCHGCALESRCNDRTTKAVNPPDAETRLTAAGLLIRAPKPPYVTYASVKSGTGTPAVTSQDHFRNVYFFNHGSFTHIFIPGDPPHVFAASSLKVHNYVIKRAPAPMKFIWHKLFNETELEYRRRVEPYKRLLERERDFVPLRMDLENITIPTLGPLDHFVGESWVLHLIRVAVPFMICIICLVVVGI